MNMLPIEKQFEIMDLIYQKLPDREITKRANKPKSTVQNYKKRGPPIYRKYAKNPLDNPYPTSVQKELNMARQQFQEILLLNNKFIMERNTANRNANDLQKINTCNKKEIERLNSEIKEKERRIKFIDGRYDELSSLTKMLITSFNKLENEKEQKDDKIKNIQDTLQQCKIELAKANEAKKFFDNTISDLTKQRKEFKDKAENLERQHEFDRIRDLTVTVLSFLTGIVVDRTVLPKIKEVILSWGAEHGINTEGYANLLSSVNCIQPDPYHLHNEATLKTNISGTLCSGVFVINYGETHAAGYDPIPSQQDGMTQAGIYHIDSGVTISTNTSGALFSGAFYYNNEQTYGTGCDTIPNQHDSVIQPDIQGVRCNATLLTIISGTLCSGDCDNNYGGTKGD